MKKAQGLPFNTIVLAVIALGVLIIVLLISTGNLGKLSKNFGSCAAKGGKCFPGEPCSAKDYGVPFVPSECDKSTPKGICCMSSGLEAEKEQPTLAKGGTSGRPPDEEAES